MAQDIDPTSGYFEDFENGQGAGASNYFTVEQDLDQNFTLLRTVFNQLNAEVKGTQGPNATIGVDIVTQNDTGSGDFSMFGTIGDHSYKVTANGGSLDVAPGQVMINGVKNSSAALVTLSPGVDDDYWVALDINGVPSIETSAAQQQLDIASATRAGGTFGTVTELAEVFFDGDAYRQALEVSGDSAAFPAKVYRLLNERLEAIELLLGGVTTDPGGDPIGPFVIPAGAEATPGLVLSDGAGGAHVDTGFFRAAAEELGVSANATEVARFVDGAIEAADGTEALPVYSFNADPDTGIRRPGTDQLALVTQGDDALEIQADGFITSDTQARAKASADPVAEIADATNVDIDWETSVEDVGGLLDVGGANPDRVTIPTGGAGWYQINLIVVYEESTSGNPNTGNERGAGISVNGTLIDAGLQSADPRGSGNSTARSVAAAQLAAADIIRGVARQDSGDTMAIQAVITAVKVW